MKFKTLKGLLLAGMLAVAGNASAGLITGKIEIIGGAEFKCSTAVPCGYTDVDQIDFGLNGMGNDGFGFVTPFSTGDFATSAGMVATMSDISLATLPSLVWAVNGFTFTVDSIDTSKTTSTFLNWTGVGTIAKTGFTSTEGFFTLTTSGGDLKATFQSTTVPAPAVLGLFGLGLIGMGFARRKSA